MSTKLATAKPAPKSAASKPVGVIGTVLDVTPELAAQWLKTSADNRPKLATHIKKLATMMKDGRWEITHQGIAFDEIGSLIDGQHRLAAVLLSGCTVKMMVTSGVARSTFAVIDTMRTRTAAQAFSLHGVKEFAASAGVTRTLWFLLRKEFIASNLKLDSGLLLSLYEQHKASISWAIRYRKAGDTTSVLPTLAYAHLKASDAKRPQVISFADKLLSGANLKSGTGPLLLRNWLSTNKGRSSKQRNEIIGKTLAALCLWVQDKTATRLTAGETIFDSLTEALR